MAEEHREMTWDCAQPGTEEHVTVRMDLQAETVEVLERRQCPVAEKESHE